MGEIKKQGISKCLEILTTDHRFSNKIEFFNNPPEIMILIALFGLTVVVNAQSEKKKEGLTTEQKAEKMTAKMKKSLNLTDEQVLKVKEANLNFIKERENLQIEIRQKNKQLRVNHKTNLQSILTAEQFKIVSDKMDKKEEKMKRKMKE